MSIMENLDVFSTPKMRRMRTEIDLNRSCSGSVFNLDELIFKSPSLDLTPKRKRKRHRTDDDCVSLQSVDISLEEPKKRRRSSLARMSSLVNLLSPIRPVKKVGQTLHKSLSLKNLMSPQSSGSGKYTGTPYKAPAPTPPKRRASMLWCDTLQSESKKQYSQQQIERQEAIFELYKSEEDLVDDLNMVKTTYHDSMAKLRLMSDKELNQIFGQISTLVPLHEDLAEALRDQRQQDGTTDSIGNVLLKWVARLREYIPYCANQIYAKALLDTKKQDPSVDDFLQRCQDSPFSRRLDLWSFLDVPRSRLVKYPLLLKNIQKLTPLDHPDVLLLSEAMVIVEDIIAEVDRETGIAKCNFTREKLVYLDDKQHHPLIEKADVILCDGILKNSRGTKLHVFLFEEILVLTRSATRGHEMRYQVYRQPIPVEDLLVEEDGTCSKSGSFRAAFSSSNLSKFMFRVYQRDGDKGQSHSLQPNDEHHKRQWISALKRVLPKDNWVVPQPTSDDESKENMRSKVAESKVL